MRTATDNSRGGVPPVTPAAASGNKRGGQRPAPRRLALRNWRVPVRLIALIAIPTLVAVFFAGLRVTTAMGRAENYQQTEKLATLGDKTSALAQAVEAERDSTAGYVTRATSEGKESVRQAHAATDAAAREVQSLAAGVDGSFSADVRRRVRDVVNRVEQLPALRQAASSSSLPASASIGKYSEFVAELIDFDDVIAQGANDERLSATTAALSALSWAKDAASRERATLFSAMLSGNFEQNDFQDFQAARFDRETAIAAFRTTASGEQAQLYDDTVTGPAIDQAEFMRARALVVAQESPNLSVRQMNAGSPRAWYDAMTGRIDAMRKVEWSIADEAKTRSRELEGDARQSALVDGLGLIAILAVALGATMVVARSLVRPLRRLRSGALDVAGNRLPGLVRRLREPDVVDQNFHVDPIDVNTTDEIGEVARAFDEVHREAVRLASNEALLRGNVNAMFVNLSRRSQSLIERQLRLIEDLEQSEQDSDRLGNLFKLDHLATRMRRNCENLLVLGGQDQARSWTKPVPLVDIVRASLSEVEQYERITLRIQDDISITGRVVNDLVHLLAEIVENATTFSPEHTKVAVSGHLLSGGGAMLQISDNGVGMAPEDLEEANWRLSNPPTVDVSVSRRMGLFVVGRLAQRHGIRVELRAALSGGLTAFVILPATAILRPDERPVDPRRLDASPMPAVVPPAPPQASGAQPLPSAGPSPELAPPPQQAPSWNRGEPTVAEPVMGASASGPGSEPPPNPRPRPEVRPQQPNPPLPRRKPGSIAPPGRSDAPAAASRPAPPRPPMSRQPSHPSPGPAPETGSPFAGDQSSSGGRGRSPIFEAMQSEWFQRRRGGASVSRAEPPPAVWSAPGDDGWRAAENVRAPAVGGQTAAGLPKRVPGRNRVPGSVNAAQEQQASRRPAESAPPAPSVQADTVRSRFASFQQGVRRGRAATHAEEDERENE